MFYNNMETQLFYETVGEGKSIVLLHGFGCDHRLMRGCMEPIFERRGGYKRFYLDLPGMGLSYAPISTASADAVLDTLVAFLQDVVPENFLLVGQSYAGYLARGLLSRLRERIDGLALICPVAIPNHIQRTIPRRNVHLWDEEYLSTLSDVERKEFCVHAVVADGQTHARYKNEIGQGLEIADEAYLEALKRQYSFSFDVDATIHERPYTKPTLILTGRQDICVGYQDQWKLVEAYPRATFSLLDMAGHNLQLDQAELFNALVEDWLWRTESSL